MAAYWVIQYLFSLVYFGKSHSQLQFYVSLDSTPIHRYKYLTWTIINCSKPPFDHYLPSFALHKPTHNTEPFRNILG